MGDPLWSELTGKEKAGLIGGGLLTVIAIWAIITAVIILGS